MAFSAIVGAVSITIVKYLMNEHYSGDAVYFGVMIPLQSIFIFASSMCFWFGRNVGESTDNYF